MMLLLPLLAVALAVPPKRSTSGLGIFLSIVFVVTYHKVNQYAEQMGALGRIDPLIALWDAVPALRRPDPLDVLDPGPQARRPADRRARAAVRAGSPSASAACSAAAVREPGGAGRRMINLQFFPSRRIALYMARLFLTRSLAVLVALVAHPDDARSARQQRQDPRPSRQWRRRAVALCRPAHAAADRPLPALRGAARHADHPGRAQPE